MRASEGWFGFTPAVLVAGAVVLAGAGFVVIHPSGGGHQAEIAAVCRASDVAAWAQQAKKPPVSALVDQAPADTSIFVDIGAPAQARLSALQALTFTGSAADDKAKLVAGEQRLVAMTQTGQADFVAAGGFANTANMSAELAEVRAIFAQQRAQRALYKSAFGVDCRI